MSIGFVISIDVKGFVTGQTAVCTILIDGMNYDNVELCIQHATCWISLAGHPSANRRIRADLEL